jgi:8-hydroxy-5-deazaflavin:NADPH oxidoreductase
LIGGSRVERLQGIVSMRKGRNIMKTAIVGLGNIGSRIAKNLIFGEQGVIVADRDPAKATQLARQLGGKAEAMPIASALSQADIVILAIWFQAIKEFVAEHRRELVGKIVVDPSNPITPDGAGGFKKVIPADQSAGAIIAGLIPEDAKFVKAFGTLGAESLGTAARRSGEPAVLFYATNDSKAGEAVAKLITASGFAPLSVGGIDQSIRIEVGGDLHEFGKIGKPVSVKEARAAL